MCQGQWYFDAYIANSSVLFDIYIPERRIGYIYLGVYNIIF